MSSDAISAGFMDLDMFLAYLTHDFHASKNNI